MLSKQFYDFSTVAGELSPLADQTRFVMIYR